MIKPLSALIGLSFALTSASALPLAPQTGFVNWETPHVHPLERGPGMLLLAVNTPDDRLEVMDAAGDSLAPLYSVSVGVDPVSVRWRGGNEVWVVNQLSDTVSIVDLATRNVVTTLETEDEPADVVFSNGQAFVSCSQANSVLVFDLADLSAAPSRIDIVGEDPRALAVGLNGEVYVAIFESGNSSTVLGGGLDPLQIGTLSFPPNVVDLPGGPWGGVNPPPNSGGAFEPPFNTTLPSAPGVSMIVRKDALGAWIDGSGGDWTEFVSGAKSTKSGRPAGWDLYDNDIAVIDPIDGSVTYTQRLMNACMSLGVHPITGEVFLVGTDGTNEIRFEPNINGTFGRVLLATVDVANAGAPIVSDLNSHLDYSTSTLPQAERDRSIGDPRAVVWGPGGQRAYVSGMGSNNVVVLDASGQRMGAPIEVGEGPTGLVLVDRRLYVLNKFESSVSMVNVATGLELARVGFHSPEPAAIQVGRKHLYDTHKGSGLGQVACATCHIDSRFDRLAWDLGDPSGDLVSNAGQNKGAGIPGLTTGFAKPHPMKGPMTTQTLQDIIGKEPLHWRGDRKGLEEFNGAFVGLQGDDVELTTAEMQEFEDFLATIHFPPNPFRELDNTLPTDLPLDGHYSTGRFTPAGTPLPNGDAERGLALYRPPNFLDAPFACVTCHTLPTGMGSGLTASGATFQSIPLGPNGEAHHAIVSVDGSKQKTIKIPQLRNLYEKVGFDMTQGTNRAGFGLLHDGSIDSIARFIEAPAFGLADEQDVADLVAFMLAFSGSDLPDGKNQVSKLEPKGTASLDTHAAVGTQLTLDGPISTPDQLLIDSLLGLAQADAVGLIVKGRVAGEARGFVFESGSGLFLSDRATEQWDPVQLAAAAAPGAELTYTVVPFGTELRAGVDRDADGWFDMDEVDAGSDPANGSSVPGAGPTGRSGARGVARSQVPTELSSTPLGATGVLLTWSSAGANDPGGHLGSLAAGYRVERAVAGTAAFAPVARVPAGSTAWFDARVAPGAYDYRVSSLSAPRSFAVRSGATTAWLPTGAIEPEPVPVRSGH